MRDRVEFRLDDLSGEPTRKLIERHLRGMYESSPAESVHAFNVDKLRHPSVRFWSAWVADEIAGCGALKQLDGTRGEIKSMRVADPFLGRGIGRAILHHLLAEARSTGLSSVWLETGSTDPFVPAIRLYESEGFVSCGPFEDYVDVPFRFFMTLKL